MASVIWRYPWMRMRISSGSDMIGRSRDQNACDSRRLSLRNRAIASSGVTSCLTEEGLQETRTGLQEFVWKDVPLKTGG